MHMGYQYAYPPYHLKNNTHLYTEMLEVTSLGGGSVSDQEKTIVQEMKNRLSHETYRPLALFQVLLALSREERNFDSILEVTSN